MNKRHNMVFVTPVVPVYSVGGYARCSLSVELMPLIACIDDEARRRAGTQQDIHSPYLICYPRTMARRFIGQRITVGYLSGLFTEAAKETRVRVKNETTGKRVRPTLRDLRPKALTDEFVVGGDSDKGGHKTEVMKRHYRRKRLPMRQRTVSAHLDLSKSFLGRTGAAGTSA